MVGLVVVVAAKVGLVGRSRETRVGSGRDAVQQAYLSDGGKCRRPSVERGEEARGREREEEV